MTTETMNVHQALTELKNLDARVFKATREKRYVVANKHANTNIGGQPISEFCDGIKAAYQKVSDLIARRVAIKRAVTLSNATTKVMVGGVEYTVAEAIEMKNHGIEFYQVLLNKLEEDYKIATNEATSNNGGVLERRADDYIKTLYGNTDLKNASDEISKVRADFIAAQTYEIIDPISIKEEMEKLEKKINSFIIEVDSALSVSNAITEITVSY